MGTILIMTNEGVAHIYITMPVAKTYNIWINFLLHFSNTLVAHRFFHQSQLRWLSSSFILQTGTCLRRTLNVPPLTLLAPTEVGKDWVWYTYKFVEWKLEIVTSFDYTECLRRTFQHGMELWKTNVK